MAYSNNVTENKNVYFFLQWQMVKNVRLSDLWTRCAVKKIFQNKDLHLVIKCTAQFSSHYAAIFDSHYFTIHICIL